MLKFTTAVVATGLALSTSIAHADGLSYHLEGSVLKWRNQDGGSDIQSNGGIDGKDSRQGATLRFSLANEFAGGWVAQAEGNTNFLSSASPTLDTDDATKFTRDVSLRLSRQIAAYEIGGFIGTGQHDDYGDSDEKMTYRFIGAEVGRSTSFGEVFAQIGRFDSADEYDEGTQDASFIRIGSDYKLGDTYVLTGAFSFAKGDKYGPNAYSAYIRNVELGIERGIGSGPLTAFTRYELSQISYSDGGDFGDTFHTINFGIKATLGGKTKHARRLPSFGKWTAYNANEIE